MKKPRGHSRDSFLAPRALRRPSRVSELADRINGELNQFLMTRSELVVAAMSSRLTRRERGLVISVGNGRARRRRR